jgi:hypothetical protein
VIYILLVNLCKNTGLAAIIITCVWHVTVDASSFLFHQHPDNGRVRTSNTIHLP